MTIEVAEISPAPASRSKPNWSAAVITGVFFVLALAQVWNHIMWRDELRPWQLMQECSSPAQVVSVMRFDAVPVLWNMMIWVMTRVSANPFLMQLVHVTIASATVYVVARWSPFPLRARILFAFGYFPFFEYAAISRNYALVFLFLMIGCALISRSKCRLLILAIPMFLLTQVSIWGAGLAMLLMMAGVTKVMWNPADRKPAVAETILSLFIVLVGLFLALLEVLPGPGASFTATWQDATVFNRLCGMFGAIYRAWIPIPAWSRHFWNSNILQEHSVFEAIIGVTMIAGAVLITWSRPIAGSVLVLGVGALMLFEFRFRGSARHHGHIFMLLIVAMWLYRTTPAIFVGMPQVQNLNQLGAKLATPALLVLLCVHAMIGISVAIAGCVLPFSSNAAIADYIKKYDPQTNVIAVPDYFGSPIAFRIGRPIYFPQMRRAAYVNTQNDADRFPINSPTVFAHAMELIQSTGHDALVLYAWPNQFVGQDTEMPVGQAANGMKVIATIKLLGSIRGGVVEDEDANLYLISAKVAPP